MKRSAPFPQTVYSFIWHFLKDYKSAVVIAIVLAFAAGFWGPFNSLLIKYIINLLPQMHNGNISILILPVSLVIINFVIFDNFTWRGLDYIRYKFTPLIINRIMEESMDYALGKSHQFYQDNLSGKLSKEIIALANDIEALINSIFYNFLRGSCMLLTATIAAYFVNPIFCFILITWSILFAFISTVLSKKSVILSGAQAHAESVVGGEIVDSLSNHTNVRIFSGKLYEKKRMGSFFHEQLKTHAASSFHDMIMGSIQGGLITLMMSFTAYFLVYLYGKNLVTIGDFALILSLSMETDHMIWFTMSEVNRYNRIIGRCKQNLSALTTPLEIQDSEDAQSLISKKGTIAFRNVTFHYQKTNPLFKHISIEIAAGEKVGLVGISGSGKSTFTNLILRLYDVIDGLILIDGQDIRTVTQDSLRAAIAMIPQDPTLFNRSIRENIRYGRVNATDQEVIEASKKAHTHQFITQLPQGYDSLVGERGIKLSGGQRQRIAIARAVLKLSDASILIIDEGTSQLDSVTENEIQKSLDGLMQSKHKTTIVIAHRLSTLKHMDRILVFDHGTIVEEGTHHELIAKNSAYKKLWDAQVGEFLTI